MDITEEMAEAVARLFHEAYERLAPQFGYETREASAVPWVEVPEANRRLVIAVAGEVAPLIAAQALRPVDDLLRRAHRAMRAIDAQSTLTLDLAAHLDGRPGCAAPTRSGARVVAVHIRGGCSACLPGTGCNA
jgi:hypothetical protein